MASATATVFVMIDLWAVAAAVICSAISIRIVCWKPKGERYRLGQSLAAWFMAACSGAYALQVGLYTLYARPVAPVSPMLVALLLVVMVQVYRARGNVAAMLRVSWEARWSGVERRQTPR